MNEYNFKSDLPTLNTVELLQFESVFIYTHFRTHTHGKFQGKKYTILFYLQSE